MLNYIWAGMILLGVIYGVCTGQMSALTGGALDSAKEAVSLCITMAGVMALWMGLMEIAQESGMIAKMTKGIRPFLKFWMTAPGACSQTRSVIPCTEPPERELWSSRKPTRILTIR